MSANLSEAAVVGACMTDEKAFWQVADLLQPNDFSHRGYSALFAEIKKRAMDGVTTDPFVIADDRPELREVIFGEPLAQSWRAGNLRSYGEAVQRTAVARRVRQAGAQISHLSGDDVLGDAQRLIGACAPHAAGGMRHIRDFARLSFEALEEKLKATGDLTGVPTSIPELDQLTGGLQPSDLIVLAARPSVGKTALALQCARSAAKYAKAEGKGKHVGIFSLEMAGAQLHDRMIAAEGQFDAKLLRTPKLMDDTDWPRWTKGTTIISDLPILIDDHSGVTIEVLCARVRQCHAANPFSLVVIDYLQLLEPPKAETQTVAIGKMTRALKNLAKELNIPILLLSQLNRALEQRANKRPMMSDLRESGSIEQDADVIIFLWRPEDSVRDYLEMVIAKQRNGEVADLAIEFIGRHQTFRVATAHPPSIKNSQARTADHYWDEAGGGEVFG